MSKVKFEKESVKKFFFRNGIYIAFAVIMFAAGISSYAFTRPKKIENTGDTASVVKKAEVSSTPTVQSVPKMPEIVDEPKKTVSEDASEVGKTESEIEQSDVAAFFVLPVSGGEILKNYSEKELQYSNTYKDWRLHTATDFKAESGEAVKSAGHGKIADVRTDALLGGVVEIDHGNGIVALYCGITPSPAIKKGDSVTAGAKIGMISEMPSESVDAPHLHLLVKVGGVVKDPIAVMGFKG